MWAASPRTFSSRRCSVVFRVCCLLARGTLAGVIALLLRGFGGARTPAKHWRCSAVRRTGARLHYSWQRWFARGLGCPPANRGWRLLQAETDRSPLTRFCASLRCSDRFGFQGGDLRNSPAGSCRAAAAFPGEADLIACRNRAASFIPLVEVVWRRLQQSLEVVTRQKLRRRCSGFIHKPLSYLPSTARSNSC